MLNKYPHLGLFLALCGVAVCLAMPVNAAPIVFAGGDLGANSTAPRPNSDAAAAAFDAAAAALGSNTIIDFESAPLDSFSSLVVAPGVTITAVEAAIRNSPFDTPEELFGYNTTAGGSKFFYEHGGIFTFTFSTPIQSFGAYFSGVQIPIAPTLMLTFNDGSEQSIPFLAFGAEGGLQFLGFTDAGAMITSVSLIPGGDFIGIDDVRFEAVPEPSTWAIFALGVLTLCGVRRFCPRLG